MSNDEAGLALGVAIGGWVVALLLLWAWWRSVRFVRLLKDLPTVRIRGIFVGLVETIGRVTSPAPVKAGITGTLCVHHHWSVSEHWTRTETYTDSKGRTQTRTVSGSDVVASGGEAIDFTLEDETGTIRVRVGGADWRDRTTVYTTVGRSDALYYSKAPHVSVGGSTGLRTFSEAVVAIDDSIYVVGTAVMDPESGVLELKRDHSEDNLLLISTATEQQVSRGRWWGAAAAYFFGLCTAAAGGWGLAVLMLGRDHWQRDPQTPTIAGIAAGAAAFVGLAGIVWLVLMRNGVVRVRTRWQRAVSLVDVQLKRRSDLLPNLVAVTQALSVHESSVHQAMAKLRSGAAAGTTLAALAEAYPALKADGAFMKLQIELSATEDRIAMARTFEVESRAAFLERLRTFPEGMVARLLGVAAPPPELGQAGQSAADRAAQATPTVNP